MYDQKAYEFSQMARKEGLEKAEEKFKPEKIVDLEKWQWDFDDGSKAIVWKVRPGVCVIT